MPNKYKILVVGIGAIGRRHLEACLNLPGEHYALTTVEPNDDNWAVMEPAIRENTIRIERFSSITEMPKVYFDVAVIATQADIRAAVLKELLDHVTLGGLVLEKVLFQNLDEYGPASDIISSKGVQSWVNCPRRLWPGYIALKERYSDQIVQCSQLGFGWDIGCNGIHYLDLFDYLCDASDVHVNAFDLPVAPQPAKRSGKMHVYGKCEGVLSAKGRSVEFAIEARNIECPDIITLHLTDGARIGIAENEPEMEVIYTDAAGKTSTETFPTLFQSSLTNGVVESIVNTGKARLVDYKKSRTLHEAFLSSLNTSMLAYYPDLPQGYCPVT
jgi:hypothetical protein